MSLKKQTQYLLVIPQKPIQQCMPPGSLNTKQDTIYKIKEANGEQLLELIKSNDQTLQGCLIYEVKRSFAIKPKTELVIEDYTGEKK